MTTCIAKLQLYYKQPWIEIIVTVKYNIAMCLVYTNPYRIVNTIWSILDICCFDLYNWLSLLGLVKWTHAYVSLSTFGDPFLQLFKSCVVMRNSNCLFTYISIIHINIYLLHHAFLLIYFVLYPQISFYLNSVLEYHIIALSTLLIECIG